MVSLSFRRLLNNLLLDWEYQTQVFGYYIGSQPMAAQGNLTLNTKVYAPRGKTGDIASWALSGDATFGGATSIVTESVRGPSKAGVSRVQFKLDVPKAADANSACACIGQEIARGIADIAITVPAGFTAAERDDFTKRIQGLVANAIFAAATTNLEGAW